MCRFVGTVPDILGLVWPRFRLKSGSESKIPSRILQHFRGPLSSAERTWHFVHTIFEGLEVPLESIVVGHLTRALTLYWSEVPAWLRFRGCPAGVRGSIFRWFFLGRTAPPGAALRRGGQRGGPTWETKEISTPGPWPDSPRNFN